MGFHLWIFVQDLCLRLDPAPPLFVVILMVYVEPLTAWTHVLPCEPFDPKRQYPVPADAVRTP